MIGVGDGVELEVLDWGGEEVPLVFLAGMNFNAHVFDDFAPRFAGDYRVVGITRRGHGASSWPESGYDSATRVEDIRVVLDELGIDEAILAGHSLGGREAASFAAAHPDRVLGMISIDGVLADDPAAGMMDAMAACRIGPDWYEAFDALLDSPALMLLHGTQRRPDATSNRDPWVAPEAAQILAQLSPLDLTLVQAPSLAVVYVPRNGTKELLFRDEYTSPACEKAWLGEIYGGIARVLEEMPHPTVVALQDTQHNIHLVTPDALEAAMRDWLRGQGFGDQDEARSDR